ncbi:MAG: xanthine dehydrogenase family protein molybdopterin-binding subunit, partial [Proteobacteria bacterium]|nr:xanthine dehydrogenase family protein molybdopterin-binding subunit [Pseudomonadota bacterium]
MAEAACKLIEVVYEVLPAVVGIKDAIAPGATLIHPEITQKSLGNDTGIHSNITKHARHQLGDPDAAFAKADVIVEREFTTSMVHQGYIEPTNATAMWNQDGKITIWSSTQGAFAVRDSTAEILRVPVSRIKAIPQEIGGGFGGKINVYLEPLAALLSRESGRPVKLIMSRAEVFQATGPAPGSWSKIKFGATKDGRLVAMTADLYMESGAYPGSDTGAAMLCIYAPYKCDDMRVDGYDVLTNRPKTAAYRAPGAPQAAFASEQVIDELAEKLGMDPIEFRLRNAAPWSAAQEGWWDRGPERDQGACALPRAPWHAFAIDQARSRCCVWLLVQWWRSFLCVIEGSTDIGGSRAAIAMQAAEILGISAEDVRPSVVDTDSIGFTGVTGGSRTTYATGLAAIEAARSVVAQMKARVAKVWSVAPDDVSYEHGSFHAGTHSMSFKEAAHHIEDTGGPVTGTGNVDQQGQGGAFASIIVDVEVDVETGKTQILEWTIVQDAGKAIHPSYVEGQLQGASAQGIGWALSEEYFMNSKGEMANTSLLDYRLPTAF